MEINTGATRSATNMILLDNIQTGNRIVDTLLLTLLLTSINYLFKWINNNVLDSIEVSKIFNYEYIIHYFTKKNVVEYEGKISCNTNHYDHQIHQTTSFSDCFKALWNHIIENVKDNKTIHSIKEHTMTTKMYSSKEDKGIYMVNQADKFLISEKLQIYAYTFIDSENSEKGDKTNSKNTNIHKTDRIIIQLYSYISDIETIKQFVDNITLQYISSIEKMREDKKFIYTLTNIKYEDSPCERWSEVVFASTRSFSNLFFDRKQITMEKVNHFLKNKDWYYNKGIPYSLGIGIHGPPGTGKTSFVKALANYTERNIICISLKLIKTKKQLDNIFFEDRYNGDNKKNSITFDKKIIVFEDIDCIGDIVLDREKKKNKQKSEASLGIGRKLNLDEMTMTSKVNMGDLLETIAEMDDLSKKVITTTGVKALSDDEPITLDDILNLWDGIRETPGRIMIISSNHYNDLDSALKRPGRIDITLELSPASRQVISEIYKHLFEANIDSSILETINDKFYSPAEIINMYMNEEQNAERFIKRLQLNEHV
jgi:ATP-dependent 26S proteasome regulatory subunit